MIGIPTAPSSRFVELTPGLLRERLAEWTDDMRIVLPVALVRELLADVDDARARQLTALATAHGATDALKTWGGGLLAVARAVGVDVFAPPATPEAITAAVVVAVRELANRAEAAEADARTSRHLLTSWGLE
jgi:hypothetical protein